MCFYVTKCPLFNAAFAAKPGTAVIWEGFFFNGVQILSINTLQANTGAVMEHIYSLTPLLEIGNLITSRHTRYEFCIVTELNPCKQLWQLTSLSV